MLPSLPIFRTRGTHPSLAGPFAFVYSSIKISPFLKALRWASRSKHYVLLAGQKRISFQIKLFFYGRTKAALYRTKLSIYLQLFEDNKQLCSISWNQEFDNDDVAASIARIVEPANEQNLDRLTAEVCGT
jgi:hypothetical protein